MERLCSVALRITQALIWAVVLLVIGGIVLVSAVSAVVIAIPAGCAWFAYAAIRHDWDRL